MPSKSLLSTLKKLAPLALACATLAAGCYSEPGASHGDPSATNGGASSEAQASDSANTAASSGGMGGTTSATGSGGTGGDAPVSICREAVAEPLPARRAITAHTGEPTVAPSEQVISVTKAALWRDFEKQTCGNSACHGGSDNPLAKSPDPFKLTINSFDQRPELGTESLARVLSSNPDEVMPPGSGDGSQRGENDPARRLGERLLAWQEAGFPEAFDLVISTGEPPEDLPQDPYALTSALGAKLTNLGSCVPHASLSVVSPSMQKEEMEARDALFAAAADSDELPDTLAETDLVSLDSAVLARRGVYSYAPTYTLFSDHAGKMRHVRVPLGKTIHYDEDTKDFDIPDNTRFYKTFLKQVKDSKGNVGYRKMETRLIVVRRDEALEGGGFRPRALRTSYAWNKGETMALRVKDPLRNGQPFADRLCPYVVDEAVTRDPQTNPISDDMSEFCGYMTADELADPSSGQVRHYAIPSTERCDQCHMGSSSRSYILGFNPWQVDRRPAGEGGIFEDPTSDELSQLERFIEYGVITGIEPGEAKLETSQGERLPRNDYELKAQGYMMGNCVFCHNPHGFPVVQNPVLAPFNLFPDSEDGGVFQFSLERFSARAKAGESQSIRFPYITPAFGDHDVGSGAIFDGREKAIQWTYPDVEPVLDADDRPPDFRLLRVEDSVDYWFTYLGPWRSLIWRNVYTPFTYNEDYTIFVHMPRNAPGYDCRAHKIMAEWMLSIPSTPKSRILPQDQPVVELLPGEDGYGNARNQAELRIEDFRISVTGQHCPTDDDIIDPKVVLSATDVKTGKKKRASPIDEGTLNSPRVAPDLPLPLLDYVPDHAHWVPTDTTDLPGRWVPRRLNWQEVLATREAPVESDKLTRVIDDLHHLHLSDEQKSFSLEPVALGAWALECQDSPEAASSPTVAELLESKELPMRRWLEGVYQQEPVPVPSARVHQQSRGEAVFRAICMNCHGQQADSRSPLAATILELTGGQTRVANFIDGLFGPAYAPGLFARDEFLINQGASAEEWMVRYVLFMGLGGTQADIPPAVLDLVATSPFYGQAATAPGARDPNMLDSAVQRCAQVLNHGRELTEAPAALKVLLQPSVKFVPGVAHYELWESLCTFQNEPVVHVFRGQRLVGELAKAPDATSEQAYRAKDDAGNWVYPPDHPVGTARGSIEIGISADNPLPWCVEVDNDGTRQAVLEYFTAWGIPEAEMPICPDTLFAEAFGQRLHKLALLPNHDIDFNVPLGNQEFAERWMRRGAMNAGIAAYYYLDGLIKGQLQASPPFNACHD